jgi:hypothetical protein
VRRRQNRYRIGEWKLLEEFGEVLPVDSSVLARGRRLELINQRHKARRQHDEVSGLDGVVCVGHACRDKDRLTRPDLDLSVGKAESQYAVQHVPRLIVRVMNVQLRRAAAAPLTESKGLARADESGGSIALL